MKPEAVGIGKFLIFLQYYAGDREQAMLLARLIADIEPCISPYADFAFFTRWDTPHDQETIDYVKKKFAHVHVFTGKSRATGWPRGPNAMVAEIFKMVYLYHKANAWAYKAYLLAEPDCLPLSETWIKELSEEWNQGHQLILGDWIGSSKEWRSFHVNGNFLFSPELPKRVPQIMGSYTPTNGWDAYFARHFFPLARPSKLIFSDYRYGTRNRPWRGCESLWEPRLHKKGSQNPLEGVEVFPAWLHGIKEPAGLACVRECLLGASDVSVNLVDYGGSPIYVVNASTKEKT